MKSGSMAYVRQNRENLEADSVREAAGDLARAELLDAAFFNMPYGLCMWDAQHRISICNDRYRDIYGFSPEIAGSGTTMFEMFEHWVEIGGGGGTSAFELQSALSAKLSSNKPVMRDISLSDGRVIAILHKPLAGGGWLSTHEDVTEGRHVEDEVHRQNVILRRREDDAQAHNQHFTAAVENMSHGLCMFDASERMIICNDHYLSMFVLDPEVVKPGIPFLEILRHSVEVGIASVTADELYAERQPHIRAKRAAIYQETLADGRIVTISHRPMADGGWVSIYEDITERSKTEADIKEQNRRFDAALANMSQGLLMFDSETRLIVRNDRILEIYGVGPEMLPLGTTHLELVESLVSDGPYAGLDVGRVVESTRTCLAARDAASVHRDLSDGRTIAVSHRPMAGGGWVATFEDVTERCRTEARITYMAHHDPLTGLVTRAVFRDRLEQALIAARRNPRPLAVLSLDLDRFKIVNDTLGHPAGDALLKSVAERLQSCVRGGADLVARLGGDEFVVLQTDCEQPRSADALAARIVDVIGEIHQIDGHEIAIGASLGIVLAPAGGDDPDTILKNADLALYRAKHEGRDGYRFYEPGMDTQQRERRALESDLRGALARREFEIHYQPEISIAGGDTIAYEALLRWRCPKRGLVPPIEFIAVAEETKLIIPIGDWVLNQACADAAAWPGQPNVAVNVSAVQFKTGTLIKSVVAALEASGLAADKLELEITETVLIDETDTVAQTLGQLRELGVRIALDDFGTGYSSLNYLRSFSFDKIKIDRSFVRDIHESGTSAIIRAIIELGASLSMSTIAEGVETSDQLEMLRLLGCAEAQGYLIGFPKPMRIADVTIGDKVRSSIA